MHLNISMFFAFIVFCITAASAQTGAGQQAPSAFAAGSFLPILIVMFVVMYFFMIRPEQRRQKEKKNMLSAIKKGDKVLIFGGIHGTISHVREDSFLVRVADNTILRVTKAAVTNVVTEKDDASTEKSSDKTEKIEDKQEKK